MTAPATTAAAPLRRAVQRLGAIDDGALLRLAFFALLAGVAAMLFVDFRELAATQDASLDQPLQPILPPALEGPNPGPMPAITTDPALLQQPLEIALGSGGVLTLTGTIDPGAAARFASEIAARGEYVQTVQLDSPGGAVRDALAIGELIHDKGLATQVLAGALCASSCPIIFAAGTTRSASPASAIGVHQLYATALAGAAPDALRMAGAAMSDAQATTAEIITALTRSGVDPALWLHALQTPPERLYYFSVEEMQRLNLVTVLLQD